MYSQALAHSLLLYHLYVLLNSRSELAHMRLWHSQRFAGIAKITDFSSRDLYFPDPDRTRSVLSAFINFIKFSEQSEAFISRLQEQSTSILRERQTVIEETEELERKMSVFK